MNNSKSAFISYEATGAFSQLVVDYQNRNDKLKPFINEFPTIEAIGNQIKRKYSQNIDRQSLVSVLTEQYENNGIQGVGDTINKLKDKKTFTICTAHQPNIFSGYLYFIYKIVHVIKLAKECQEHYPDYQFVPIYFIGSEDNDIDEIGAFNFKEKKYQWTPNESGACGRFSTESLLPIRDEILSQFGNSDAELKLRQQIIEAYNGKRSLSEATQYFVHALFGQHGLLSLDADDKRLKESFKGIIRDELENQSSHRIVSEHNIKLAKNYKVQVEPREVNFFFMKDNFRERIEKDGKTWKIVDSVQKMEDLNLVDQHPEYFSPNVILRPVYQELILPNVAFVGGGSEIAYWCELKPLFEQHKIIYPLIVTRNSLSIVSNKLFNKISNIGFEESFKSLENALKEKSETHPAYKQLLSDLKEIDNLYKKSFESTVDINPNLTISVAAQLAKIQYTHERIKTKYRSHIKREYEDTRNQRITILEALYPNNRFQERHENYLEMVCRFKIDLIPVLIRSQKGFNRNYMVLAI